MSKATFTFGRFNPPTEEGHGKLVSAVQSHAEESGGKHYVFPTHTQDKKKNPLSHEDKVHAMKKLFPGANVVSHDKVRTAIDAMKHLESKGHTHVTMVVGSDRVDEFHGLLNKYRKKEFPGIKKVDVKSAGHRDPDAEGAEGMSASKLRGLVAAGKKKEFVSHYSDPKLGAHIHDKVKAGLQMESTNPVGIFLLGGPGSGKDYVLKNIFSRFDLTEVQADQILNGAAVELFESNQNIVINGANDAEKIELVQNLLEGYTFDFVHVSVTNKVSRLRNEQREQPISESKRIDKYLKAEQLAKDVEAFSFNNSINLNESSEMERVFFGSQIERLLERITELGLEIKTTPEPKTFFAIKEKYFPPVAKHKSGLPKKYVGKLSDSTAAARKAHWKKMSKYSDKDPRAYKPAPGDATSKTKPSKHTLAVRKMMGEQMTADVKPPHGVEDIAAKHNVSTAVIIQALTLGKQVEMEHTNDEKTAEIIALGHLWEKPDYYDKLKQMEQHDSPLVKMTAQDHINAERKDQIRRDRRDWRILHHQNKHIHKAMVGEAEDLPKKLRKVPRSGNITQVMDKRQETGRVNEESGTSLAAKAKKSGISVGTLRKVYNRGVAAWNSGHRPGTTPQQWGHARVNSYINKGKTYHTADKDLREEEQIDEMDKSQPAVGRDSNTPFPKRKPIKLTDKQNASAKLMTRELLNQAKKQLKKDVKEEVDINELFEMQLVGTDEYRKHAIAMTPGQTQEIEDAFPVKSPNKKPAAVVAKPGKSIVSQYTAEESDCECGGDCGCSENESVREGSEPNLRSFRNLRGSVAEAKKEEQKEVDTTPTLGTKKKKGPLAAPRNYDSTLHGLPVTSRFSAYEETEVEPNVTLEEAVQYHLDNKISFTENVFRPGSDMFFQMISEAKKFYAEGKYQPKDEWEKDMLASDIGEKAIYEGQEVILDFPFEEEQIKEDRAWTHEDEYGMHMDAHADAMAAGNYEKAEIHAKKAEAAAAKHFKTTGEKIRDAGYTGKSTHIVNEEDKTEGKGIGKPWREGGGGAVYVRDGDSIRKVRFSQSGMKKKYMDPGATRSFVARHHCLTNKDKTSASYWACRWPRFFSNSGKVWW